MSRRQSSPTLLPPLSLWIAPAFLLGLTVYLCLFFAAAPQRVSCLIALLLPDEVVLSWVGGSLQRFNPWDRVPVLLASLLILTVGFTCGRLTLRKLVADGGLSNLEIAVFSIGTGLSELSLMTLILGLAGALHHSWLFLAVLVVVMAVYVWMWRRGEFRLDRVDDGQIESGTGADRIAKYGLWCGVPFLLMILLGGMMPPWDFDVREYHLQVPKEWFQAGRISFLPHNVYGNMPLGVELHAVLGMVLWPGESAWWWGAMVGKTVMAAFAPLTCVALVAAGRRLQQPVAGVAGALVFISTPWIVHVSVTGLNEGAVAFYLTLTLYAALLWSSSRGQTDKSAAGRTGNSLLLLAGFFAGSAVACKYPAVLFLVLPLGAWVLLGRRRWDWKPALLFGLAVACACGPWLAKNAALTGNPVYPLVFGGRTRTPERLEQWNRAHRVPRDADGHCYTPEAAANAVAQVGWRSLWLSPLVLPLAALAFAGARWRRLALILGLFCAYYLATWWIFTHRIDRFWIPLLPILSLLSGLGVAGFWHGWWKRLLTGVLVAGLAWCGMLLLTSSQDPRYLVSLAELRRGESVHAADAEQAEPSRVNPVHRWLNDAVPEGCGVLLVGDAQPFDLAMPALYNTCFDENILEQLIRNRTKEERLRALQNQKISHVYVQWSDIDRYCSPGNYGFTDYVTRQLIREELVQQQRILQPIDLGLDPERDEVFAVIPLEVSSPVPSTAAPIQPE